MVLINDICVFKKLYNNDSNKKYDVICTSFFKMNKHYKNFNIYINGLKEWIKRLKSIDTLYKFRLFIDENIYNDKVIMNIINSNLDLIQPILFTCSDYIKGTYHFDVFGALVRYFPLFDFEENDTNNVFVVDIDLKSEDYFRFKSMIKLNTIINVFASLDRYFKDNSLYIISCLMHFNAIKYDKNIFINFIKSAHTIVDTGQYNKRFSAFGYGTDEIFINQYLLSNIDIIYCQINYNINWFIYHNLDLIKTNKNSYKILKYILGDYYNIKYDINKMITVIDNSFYRIYKRTVINNYFTNRSYKIIKYMYKNNINWMLKSHYNIILKIKKKNILLCNLFIGIDIKKQKILNIIDQDQVYLE